MNVKELYYPIGRKKYSVTIPNLNIRNKIVTGCGDYMTSCDNDIKRLSFKGNDDPFFVYKINLTKGDECVNLDYVEVDDLIVRVDRKHERTRDRLLNLKQNDEIALVYGDEKNVFFEKFVCVYEAKKKRYNSYSDRTMYVPLVLGAIGSAAVVCIDFDTEEWIENVTVRGVDSSWTEITKKSYAECTLLVLEEDDYVKGWDDHIKNMMDFVVERVGSLHKNKRDQLKHQYEVEDAYSSYRDMKSGERRFLQVTAEEEEEAGKSEVTTDNEETNVPPTFSAVLDVNNNDGWSEAAAVASTSSSNKENRSPNISLKRVMMLKKFGFFRRIFNWT